MLRRSACASVSSPEPTPERSARAPFPDAWWRLSVRQRRVVAGTVVAAAIVLIAAGVWALTRDSEPTPAEFVAALPPERVAMWDALAECESGGRWDLSTGNGLEGGLQFEQSSWLEVGGEGSPAAASREEQIMRAEFLYDLQGWDAWPACSAQLGLTD